MLIFYSGARGAPWVNKSGNLSIRENLVLTSAYVPRPYRLWGRGRGATKQPDVAWRVSSFLGGKSHGVFLATSVFLAGNRMTIVAFFKKALVYLAKRLFDSNEVLNLRKKPLISINGEKRILTEGEKFKFKGLHLCFFTPESLSCSETPPSK